MKIEEKNSNIKLKGAKISTADRPENLSKFLNYNNLTLIIGLPGSGKTSLVHQLLNGTKTDNLYNDVFHSVYYISPSNTVEINIPDEKFISLADEELEDILEEIIDNERDLGEEDEPHHALIILDDAVNYLKSSALKTFRKLIMNGRHVLGPNSSLQLWLITQKIKSVPLTIRSQANQIFFFDSTKAEKEVLRDEFLPLDKEEAGQLYKYIFDKPHNFLFTNLQMPKNSRMFKNFNQLLLSDM